MSKYDSIKTAKEMIAEVMIHGLSLDPEDICRVQDIFGNTPMKELADLANDIGRNDADGNPDPNGSWSSTRRETRSTFYMILTHIWNFEEVVRFWNHYTNPEHNELKELQTKLHSEMQEHVITKNALKIQVGKTMDEHKRYLEASRATAKEAENVTLLKSEVHYLKMQIIELKAKLYDMMEKEEK